MEFLSNVADKIIPPLVQAFLVENIFAIFKSSVQHKPIRCSLNL